MNPLFIVGLGIAVGAWLFNPKKDDENATENDRVGDGGDSNRESGTSNSITGGRTSNVDNNSTASGLFPSHKTETKKDEPIHTNRPPIREVRSDSDGDDSSGEQHSAVTPDRETEQLTDVQVNADIDASKQQQTEQQNETQ